MITYVDGLVQYRDHERRGRRRSDGAVEVLEDEGRRWVEAPPGYSGFIPVSAPGTEYGVVEYNGARRYGRLRPDGVIEVLNQGTWMELAPGFGKFSARPQRQLALIERASRIFSEPQDVLWYAPMASALDTPFLHFPKGQQPENPFVFSPKDSFVFSPNEPQGPQVQLPAPEPCICIAGRSRFCRAVHD